MPRILRKKWRELILKVWEVDPFICPVCARLMHVAAILENPARAAVLLKELGWHAYATDSQGARAPPPTADHEAPELPFASFLDGIVYELEPWEQARRERLASYARERDDLAGIVFYDGEWDDTNDSPSEHETRRQDLDESQETSFPDDFDQRPPPQWEEDQWDQRPIGDPIVPQTLAGPDTDQSPSDDREERQWDQTPPHWSDTPLGEWAIEANRWDGVDPIPPDEEPAFYADQPAGTPIPAGRHRGDASKRQNDKSPRAAPVNLRNAAFVGTNGHSTVRKIQETQSNGSFCHLPGPNDVTILMLESNIPN